MAKKAKPLTQRALTLKGKKLGLDPSVIVQLITVFGPQLTELLVKWLERRRRQDKKMRYSGPVTGPLGEFFLKRFIIDFLVDNRDTILEWIDDGEEAIFDAIMAIVGKQSGFLAGVLKKYKKKLVSLDDEVSAALIDRLIAALQK